MLPAKFLNVKTQTQELQALLHVRIKWDGALGRARRADKEQGQAGVSIPFPPTGNDGHGKPTCVIPAALGAAAPVPGG